MLRATEAAQLQAKFIQAQVAKAGEQSKEFYDGDFGLSIVTGASRPSLRSRQLGPIEAEFLADPVHVALIEVLVRTT